ncbi:hypothetical protein QE152_g15600 [Popillia japonica]|uniref:Uncharacterized protein n=1 Tax=Popillia japonica TaxID=7064 RepID=A0AAW1L7Q4_POPJA
MSSTEEDTDVAFKVLNKDELPMTVIGESIMKPFGKEHQKYKPNVVVYPTRRITTQVEDNMQDRFVKSNGFVNPLLEKGSQNLKKNNSNNQTNLNHYNSVAKGRNYNSQNNVVTNSFAKTLDAKLKKLQRDEKYRTKRTTDLQNRPLFVTTVKKGQFLEPPPEIANLLGFKIEEQERKDQKKMYEYANKPRVLTKTNNTIKLGHKTRCEAAAKAAALLAASVAGIRNEDNKDVNANITMRPG